MGVNTVLLSSLLSADASTVVGISTIYGIPAVTGLPFAVDVCDAPIALLLFLVVICYC